MIINIVSYTNVKHSLSQLYLWGLYYTLWIYTYSVTACVKDLSPSGCWPLRDTCKKLSNKATRNMGLIRQIVENIDEESYLHLLGKSIIYQQRREGGGGGCRSWGWYRAWTLWPPCRILRPWSRLPGNVCPHCWYVNSFVHISVCMQMCVHYYFIFLNL